MATDPYRLQRQTQAKHDLLRHYLLPWARVLSSAGHKKLMFIDGFSFTGQYTSDEDGGPGGPGSPLIALECFTGDKAPKAKGLFLFVDQEKRYIEELKENIAKWPHKRETDQIRFRAGEFSEAILPAVQILEEYAASANLKHEPGSSHWCARVIPAFIFVDPYGVSGFPLDLLARVLGLPRTEVFINLMWVRTALNLQNPAVQDAGLFTRMFGSDEWRNLTSLAGEPLRRAFLDLYLTRLRAPDGANARFVRSFEMCGKDGAVAYWMVFCTNSSVGLVKMKEAMWKVDPGGRFVYRDTTAREQGVLFTPTASTQPLRQAILERFAGQRGVRVKSIIQFVNEETAYLERHLRAPVLKPLEQEALIVVNRKGAKAGSFKEDATIDFVRTGST